MNNKKKILISISVIGVIAIVIGISYALWTFNITQTGVNTITSGCLKLEITNESDAISLSNAYPISDEEGMKLEPYTFTINNSCSASVDYNISLEMMDTTDKLATNYVAISVDNGAKKILNTLSETELTYNKGDYTPYEGRMLLSGVLKGNESKTHSIRLWLDEGTPAIDEAMNKTFISKVVLNATLKEPTSGEKFAQAVLKCDKDAATCLKENSSIDTINLAYDETADNNLRYIGSNPNNYVLFNDELWRIIGVMNNIEDENGNIGSHLKLIRNESIGRYSWDNKAKGTGSSTDEKGSNDWTDSALMEVLNNGAYWNRTSGNCPSAQNGATIECDFSSNGLTDGAKSMITNVVWNLGGVPTRELPASTFYTNERGTEVYEGRPTEWTGKVGLMYPSDYGYAVGNSVRNECLNTNLGNYDINNCYANDWLFIAYQWTLTPFSGVVYDAFRVNDNGIALYSYVYYRYIVKPVLYLDSNVRITGSGDGSESSPYELSGNKVI